ncbi:MAG TPA: ABC transporter ATP-binding protein [Erysipelotrichaceae bacterium]|nr:ABC transporter ATP-binding protein [Erysipelotrichaceae bacterium]
MSLKVKDLHFSYKDNPVLKDVAFSIKKGDYLAVLGTNGAGKSTLLKNLNAILSPDLGQVYLNNLDTSNISRNDLAKSFAYVPQSHDNDKITVFDAVLLGRKPYIKWDVSSQDLKLVEDTLELLDLTAFSMTYTDQLSGGELQKVVIARALVQQPEILLLDEPTSNLDLKNQIEVLELTKSIVDSQSLAAVVSIHDLNLALRYANKFLLLKDGKIYDFGDKSIINSKSIKAVYGVDVVIEKYLDKLVVIPI